MILWQEVQKIKFKRPPQPPQFGVTFKPCQYPYAVIVIIQLSLVASFALNRAVYK